MLRLPRYTQATREMEKGDKVNTNPDAHPTLELAPERGCNSNNSTLWEVGMFVGT
jgi:hypothetical protein